MAEPTLVQVLGSGATQDINSVTISKTDLATVGLTASADNTAESLLTAITLLAAQYLSETNQTNDPDIQVTVVDSGFPSLVSRNSQNYRRVTYNVNFDKLDASGALDPDDY